MAAAGSPYYVIFRQPACQARAASLPPQTPYCVKLLRGTAPQRRPNQTASCGTEQNEKAVLLQCNQGRTLAPMASEDPTNPLAESGVTMHSDSEQYSAGEDLSASPQSSGSPVILYRPPTVWSLVRGAAINLLLPFINGMMLGFGELFAHEAAFRLGWSGTKVKIPDLSDDLELLVPAVVLLLITASCTFS